MSKACQSYCYKKEEKSATIRIEKIIKWDWIRFWNFLKFWTVHHKLYAKFCNSNINLFSEAFPYLSGFWLCCGFTSQSTIFQSCRDGAIASWVLNQYFRGVKCLAQGHNTAAVGLEPRTSRSGVRHSTTEPPRSPLFVRKTWKFTQKFLCSVIKTQYG